MVDLQICRYRSVFNHLKNNFYLVFLNFFQCDDSLDPHEALGDDVIFGTWGPKYHFNLTCSHIYVLAFNSMPKLQVVWTSAIEKSGDGIGIRPQHFWRPYQYRQLEL